MIIHISRDRFTVIKNQGYVFGTWPKLPDTVLAVGHGDTNYHVLNKEIDVCPVCEDIFESVDATSAVEMETIKVCMSFGKDPAPFLAENRKFKVITPAIVEEVK